MNTALALGITVVAACSCTQAASTPGPLGKVSLRAAGAPPVAAQAPTHGSKEAQICGRDDFAPAVVRVEWDAVVDGGQGWLLDGTLHLVSASEGLVVTAGAAPVTGGASLTPGDPWNGVATVVFDCSRRARRGLTWHEINDKGVVQIAAIDKSNSSPASAR